MKPGTQVRYIVQILNEDGSVNIESSPVPEANRAVGIKDLYEKHFVGATVKIVKETITVEREDYTPCAYTHSHTRSFCGNSACRES